ncbi:MAG: hypothetical protein IJU50_04240, partial [Lachnospiraceae bacterium]|nr:hypothetical protein [Lachnospiraceae bacterium]
YLTIGNVIDNEKIFDLRYLGQSVGSITVKGDEVRLNVSNDQSKASQAYFGYEMGAMTDIDWNKDEKAAMFRRFFKSDIKGLPRQKEHMYESALFSELEKGSSANKTLCGITTVDFAKTRIHMKTAVKASDSGNGTLEISDKGGEIDLFCRRSIKPGRGESRLVVIELKDENKSSESFDKAMKQAISYAIFIRELIYSEAGEDWMKIWGMQYQKRQGFTIDCVVAMPQGKTVPSYAGDRIELDNDDALELHYIEITSKVDGENAEDVEFNTSMRLNTP